MREDFPFVMNGALFDPRRTGIMGVLNITPDSFSDGGLYLDHDDAVDQGSMLAEEGADILDIGGESTRPGADPVPAEVELERVLPVISTLHAKVKIPISIDTYKAEVARGAVDAGAVMINDISGLTMDPDLAKVAALTSSALVLGHIRGTPKTMQQYTDYEDFLVEVIDALRGSIARARAAGVAEEKILVDPGIGFGKTVEQNLYLIEAVDRIRTACRRPVMLGPSRKSFIGAITGASVDERLHGTLAAVSAAVLFGVAWVRVHDVKPARQAAMLAQALRVAMEEKNRMRGR